MTHAVKDFPDVIIYFLTVVSIGLLLSSICYGGYHICYLGRNILTDDFHEHLVALPPGEVPEQRSGVRLNVNGHAQSIPEIQVNERVPRTFQF
jgi:hypothetical protein